MSFSLKPLSDQTIVITGASSGIGLATARRAAREGANVVLVARNEQALREAVDSITVRGGSATYVAVDVTQADAPEKIAAEADAKFGGFDTWVNDAAVAMYAKLMDTSVDEQRRVFEVGYFGLVNASLYAARRLGVTGGALINVGSVLSERAVPIQGAYSAMKHAVLGFTEALRMELEADDKPISVTLIKPNGIDTPYPEHARNKLDTPDRIPPIVYDPELVAKAICFAAAHKKRELLVGGQGYVLTTLGNAMPRTTDLIMEKFFGKQAQTIDTPPEPGAADNLYEPRRDGRERSNQDIYVRQQSLALEAQMHPLRAAAIVGSIGAIAAFAFSKLGKSKSAGAHQPDGTDSTGEFEAGIADENMIPEGTARPDPAAKNVSGKRKPTSTKVPPAQVSDPQPDLPAKEPKAPVVATPRPLTPQER